MKIRTASSEPVAFTRLELLVVLGTLALLAAVALPALATTKARSDRAGCVSNLRQIGQGFRLYGSDHGDANPWQLNQPDGTHESAYGGVVWVQFSFISNYWPTPRILLCPADSRPGVQAALNWGTTNLGGFASIACRNNSLSYFLSLHGIAAVPESLLSGDYNIPTGAKTACSSIPGWAWPVFKGDPTVAWTNAAHGLTGNLLLNDGRVLETSSAGLRKALMAPTPNDEVGTYHLLLP